MNLWIYNAHIRKIEIIILTLIDVKIKSNTLYLINVI